MECTNARDLGLPMCCMRGEVVIVASKFTAAGAATARCIKLGMSAVAEAVQDHRSLTPIFVSEIC